MRRLWMAIGLAAALGSGGCGPSVPPAISEGEARYQSSCAVCHGRKGQGLPALGAPLVGSEFVAARDDAELVAFLAQGRPKDHPDNSRGVEMPPRGMRGDLSDEDLAKIVAFLRTLRP